MEKPKPPEPVLIREGFSGAGLLLAGIVFAVVILNLLANWK